MRRGDGVRRPARALPILPHRRIGPELTDELEAVKRLLEGSVDAAVILDRERRILYYNRAYDSASRIKGRRLREEVEKGARCFEVLPLAVCQTACVGCKALDSGRSVRVDEIGATRGDGEELTFIVSAIPFGDFIIESYRDVTAEVRIQRRLKGLLENERKEKVSLEEMVEERTRDLKAAQGQLVLQEKMSSLGRLVAGVAHELNNPINFVYGNVDFLGQYMDDLLSLVQEIDRAELPAEVRERLEATKKRIEYDFLVEDSRKLINSIRAGAERTAAIVHDLKSFSRTTGRETQESDVIAGIETTLNLISPLHKGRITIERDYQPELPKIVCNAGHVNQVFMNILTNAAQAIRGRGTIRIRVQTASEDGRDLMRVAISDTGQGIPKAIMQKIRDPFFTTKEVGEGTGLGLWISDNIVRAHGGRLTFESQEGVGSTFTVTLPLRPPPQSEPHA